MTVSTFYPAGSGPAGWAPVADPSGQAVKKDGQPVYYEPRTRDFAGADGVWAGMHSVDQQVDLALMIEKGKLASNPEQGHTLRQFPRLNPVNIQAEVRDRVNQALSLLLDATPALITILGVASEIRNRQLLVSVRYRNNVTAQERITSRVY